jgi:hypothetical protein
MALISKSKEILLFLCGVAAIKESSNEKEENL